MVTLHLLKYISHTVNSTLYVGHTATVLCVYCNMAACSEYIKSEFPLIDDDLYQYVEGTYCYYEF
jgi:hypothetical protein